MAVKKPTKAQIKIIKKWIKKPASARPKNVKKLFQTYRPWIRANLVKKNNTSSNRPGGSKSTFETYFDLAQNLASSFQSSMDPRFESIVNSLMGSFGPGAGGFELPPPPSISVGGGGISVPSLVGSNYPSAVAEAQFGAAIADVTRQLDLARAQAAENVKQISDWYQQPITRQEQAISENQAAFEAAGEDLQAAAQGVLAATGAEADPALAAALGSFAIAATGALEASQASQHAFDQAMVPALQAQRNDAILFEERLQAGIQRDLQHELGQLQRQKAATAAQVAGELAIRQAELQFQAAQAAADRSLQASIANAEVQSQWAQLMAQLSSARFDQQLQLANLLAGTGSNMNLSDIANLANLAFQMDVAGTMLPFEIAGAKLDLAKGKADIALTQSQVALNQAEIKLLPLKIQNELLNQGLTKAQIRQINNQIKIANKELTQKLKQARQGPIPGFGKLTTKDLVDLRNLLVSSIVSNGRLTMHPLTAWTALGNALRGYSNGKWNPAKNSKVNAFRNRVMQEIFTGRTVSIKLGNRQVKIRNAINWNGVIWKFQNGRPRMIYRYDPKKKRWFTVKPKKK